MISKIDGYVHLTPLKKNYTEYIGETASENLPFIIKYPIFAGN